MLNVLEKLMLDESSVTVRLACLGLRVCLGEINKYGTVPFWVHLLKHHLYIAIKRADFVSSWMWFNGSATKVQRHLFTNATLLPSYVYNMYQDMKSARLIAVCKRSLTDHLYNTIVINTNFGFVLRRNHG